jgi:NADH-ubiquinone oxidoreductase chain 4
MIIPFIGIFLISTTMYQKSNDSDINYCKSIALITSITTLILSFIIYILFDFSTNQFQFVQENYNVRFFDIYLGVDGLSIYFVLLTTIIIPIALLSN